MDGMTSDLDITVRAWCLYVLMQVPRADRIATAEWAIRCLANPDCEGSGAVLEAIEEGDWECEPS
jgi:hypothetical protein